VLNYNELLDFCQTEGEMAVVTKASEDGRPSLNDMGERILRRVIARSPEQRKKLSAYNRVYQARARRVKKGVWPANAPTASQAVELGILDKSDQYTTRRYIKAVNTHLGLDDSALRPTNDNLIVLDKGQRQVALPGMVEALPSRKSALNILVVGEEPTTKAAGTAACVVVDEDEPKQTAEFNQKHFAEFMVERADTIKQDMSLVDSTDQQETTHVFSTIAFHVKAIAALLDGLAE